MSSKFVNMTQGLIHVRDTQMLPGVEIEVPDEDQGLAGFKLMLKTKEVVPFEDPSAKAKAEKVAADAAALKLEEDRKKAEAAKKAGGGGA